MTMGIQNLNRLHGRRVANPDIVPVLDFCLEWRSLGRYALTGASPTWRPFTRFLFGRAASCRFRFGCQISKFWTEVGKMRSQHIHIRPGRVVDNQTLGVD